MMQKQLLSNTLGLPTVAITLVSNTKCSTFCIFKSLKYYIFMNNCFDGFKIDTGVKYQKLHIQLLSRYSYKLPKLHIQRSQLYLTSWPKAKLGQVWILLKITFLVHSPQFTWTVTSWNRYENYWPQFVIQEHNSCSYIACYARYVMMTNHLVWTIVPEHSSL